MSSYVLINGEERITIKLIMDNNCNKLHIVSLSKVNKRMFNQKNINQTAVLWFEFLSIIIGVMSFAYKVYICHERSSRDKGKKRNTKKF